MKAFRPSVRRVLTIAAAALVGAAATLVIASPASAHTTILSAVKTCDQATGQWVVVWTISSSNNATTYQLTSVSSTSPGSTLSGDTAPPSTAFKPIAQPFTVEQRVPGSAVSSSLTVSAKWNNNNTSTTIGTKSFYGDTCVPPTTTPPTTAPPTTTPPTTTTSTTTTAPPATTTPPLADTGNNVGSVIGIGAGLVGAGVGLVGLFFLLRRRRANIA